MDGGNGGLETEILLRLTQFERQLARAEAKAIATANKAEKTLAKIDGKPFDHMAERYVAATTAMQQRVNAFVGVKQGFDGAADSARAFEAALQQQRGIQQLQASLDPAYAATMRYESAVEQVQAAVMSGAITQQQANQVLALAEARYRGAGAAAATMDRAMVATGGGMNNLRFQVQNASYQVGDFAVQVGAGTSAAQALGQQLPQFLGGFGMVGALMGTVAAIAIPLGRAFFATGEKAKTLDEQLKALASSMNDLDSATRAANSPVEDILRNYGAYADQAAALLEVQRELAYVDATRALTATATSIADAFGELERLGPAVEDLPEYIQAFQAEFGQLNADRVTDMAEALGITKEQAIGLAQAMVDLEDADGPEAQAKALKAIIDALADATGGAMEMNVEAAKLYDSLLNAWGAALKLSVVDLVSNITPAADEAGRLASNFAAALSLQNQIDAQENSGGRGDGMAEWQYRRTGRDTKAGAFVYDGPSLDVHNNPVEKGGKGKGGGRGKKDAFDVGQDEIDQLQRSIEMIGLTKAQVAELEARYEMLAEAKRRGLNLDKAQAGSLISLRDQIDQNAAAIGRLTAEYEGASERSEFLTGMQEDLKNGFLDAVIEGENLSDVMGGLAKSLARAALEAALFKTGPLAGGGGGLGGLLSGLFGRATGGGVQAGQAYRVNEARGPSEVFVPSQSGAVLSVSQAQRALAAQDTGRIVYVPQPYVASVAADDGGSIFAMMRRVSSVGDAQTARAQQRALPAAIRSSQARGLR